MEYDKIVWTLIKRMERKNYSGLDPSTVRYNPRLLQVLNFGDSNPLLSRIWRSIIYRSVFYLGHRTNRFLEPNECSFVKGLALMLSALAHIYVSSTKEKEVIIKKILRIESLIQEKQLFNQYLWAHDCDYKIQNTPVTTKTPNLITTAFVAKSYWDLWCATDSEVYKDKFLTIVDNMVNTFPCQSFGGKVCFMYTPNTKYFVHNANLLMNELLGKSQYVTKNGKYIDLMIRSISYSCDDYKKTNSFYYAGPPTQNKTIDNYHTGYILRSLNSIKKFVPELAARLDIDIFLKNGIEFYYNKFLNRGKIWRDTGNVIETHSLAESILFAKEFAYELTKEQSKNIYQAINNTFKELWDADEEYFINKIIYLPFGWKIKDKTDMIRWSQSWMVYALSYNVNLERPK